MKTGIQETPRRKIKTTQTTLTWVLFIACLSVDFLVTAAQADSHKKIELEKSGSALSGKFKGEYFLTLNEDSVCAPFTKNLNQFRNLDFDQCAPRLSEKYPEFSRPEWREVPLDLDIAEKAFRDVSLAFEKSRVEMDKKWQAWLQDTIELRASGEVKMWLAEADINNDGISDPIARVQYANPASSLPVKQRGCMYAQSGLRKLSPNQTWLYDGLPHFFFGWSSDIIYSAKTRLYYSIAVTEVAVDPGMVGEEIGATRGIIVYLARTEKSSPTPVCHISWLPTGNHKLLRRKSTWSTY